MTRAVAVDLDGALGDTHPLWAAFLEDAARRFRSIAVLDPSTLPAERGAAADALDGWAAGTVGDWRGPLERFAEDHAPVFLRPAAGTGAAVRGLAAAGVRVGVFTDAPEELARVALAHLGVARHVALLVAGERSLERLEAELGPETVVVRSARDLTRIRADGASI